MANTMLVELPTPAMAETAYRRAGTAESIEIVPATSAPTPVPDGDTPYVATGHVEAVAGFAQIAGTVTALALEVYQLQDGDWYWHSAYTFSEIAGNTRFAIELLGKYTAFTVRVAAISGGGSVAVRVLGVWT